MDVVVLPDGEGLGDYVARRIITELASRPSLVLGVATGSSPEPVYRALAARGADLSSASAFALDEYVGLPAGHPQSYREVLRAQLVGPLSLRDERLHVPDGTSANPDDAAQRYEAELARSGGVDLQLLGIGRNGHIGFNEPGSPFDSRTRVVDLTDDTREANGRFFASLDEVPRRSITQGLGTIFGARRIILVAQGMAKARAIERMVNGPVTPGLPASLLQRHPDAIAVITEDAASELSVRVT